MNFLVFRFKIVIKILNILFYYSRYIKFTVLQKNAMEYNVLNFWFVNVQNIIII